MNAFLESRYAEGVQRLALGLEPFDSERRARVAHPLSVTFDAAPAAGLARPSVERHDSCLHVLRYFAGTDDQLEVSVSTAPGRAPRRRRFKIPPAAAVTLRIDDPSRRYVPRRLTIPLLKAADAEAPPFRPQLRTRRPVLFPGAAYDVHATATGLRGRVTRGGRPMRWARVEARLPNSQEVVARAHGDDRGEFLLILGPRASPFDELGKFDDPVPVVVTVFGPQQAPAPNPPAVAEEDPLWDLQPEEAAPPGQSPDPVMDGTALPGDYISTPSSERTVNFFLGRLLSGIDPFVFS
jgi:hypothetical protein